MTWVSFDGPFQIAARRTKTWVVVTRRDGAELGEVRYSTAWRRFAFFPTERSFFEEDCLREIATFCEQATTAYRATRS